jgi:hypothetical protein
MELRDRLAETIALSLNGPASDGRGWYRTDADRIDCYSRADALLNASGWTLLALTENGPGSRASIAEYVRTVIEQRTVPNDDTTAERLAQGITTSILHRLGSGYTAATKR